LTPAGQQLDHGSRTSKTGKGSAASEAAAKLKDASYLKALQKAEKKQREVIESLKDVFEEDHDAELQVIACFKPSAKSTFTQHPPPTKPSGEFRTSATCCC